MNTPRIAKTSMSQVNHSINKETKDGVGELMKPSFIFIFLLLFNIKVFDIGVPSDN